MSFFRNRPFSALAFFTALAFLLVIHPKYPLRVCADVAYFIQSGQFLLEGKTPYVDTVDINPPLIYYINAIPALISRISGLHPILAFKGFFLVFLMGCLWLTNQALCAFTGISRARRAAILGSLVAFSLFADVLFTFGQRDHFFALAFLPYFFFTQARAEGKGKVAAGRSALSGALCGLLACLKPHFVLELLVFEVWIAWRFRRSLRPWRRIELVSLVTTGLAYGAHILLLPKAMSNGFWRCVVPLVAAHYQSYDMDLSRLLRLYWPTYLVTLAVFLPSALRTDPEAPMPETGRSLALFALASLGSFQLQHKGWPYQLLPLYAAWFAFLPSGWAPRAARARAALPTLIPLCLAYLSLSNPYLANLFRSFPADAMAVVRYYPPYLGVLEAARTIWRESAPGDRVMVFSADPFYSYPTLTQQGRRPGTRYYYLFPLSFFNDPRQDANERARAKLGREESDFVENLASDLIREPSRLILFVYAQAPDFRFLPEGFDPYRYAERAGILSRIGFAENYELVEANHDFRAYRLKKEGFTERR